VLVGLAAAAVVVLRPGSGGPTRPSQLADRRLVGAQDFDPLGDGHESHALVGLAIDGNPFTAWPTEVYDSRDFGHAKAGVGIYVTLAAPATVRSVSVSTLEAGWNGVVYGAASPAPTLAGWGQPLAAGTNLGTRTRFTLRSARPVGYVLLWITYLPPSGKLDVAEIAVQ